jgi:hypothetical protein
MQVIQIQQQEQLELQTQVVEAVELFKVVREVLV